MVILEKEPKVGLLDLLMIWLWLNYSRIIGGIEILDILGDIWDLMK